MLILLAAAIAVSDTVPAWVERWVPAAMDSARIPGLAVALITNGRLSWHRAFGMANILTGSPADDATRWPVASLGKPVTAYAALRLVQQGRLRLDDPLVQDRPDLTFAPRGPEHDAITLRHLLTHTAGFSNYLRDRRRGLRFAPGDRFSYSGVGYMYLQEVVARAHGGTFDQAMADLVFTPLAMPSAFFGEPRTPGPVAAPHTSLNQLLPPGGIMLGFTSIGAWVLLVPLSWLARRRWRFGRWHEVLAVVVAAPVAWALLARLGGAVMATYFTALTAALALVPLVAAVAVTRLARRASRGARFLLATLVLAGAAAGVWAARAQPLPLPLWYGREGNAAASLRTTMPDLARFVEALVAPAEVDPAVAGLLGRRSVQSDSAEWWGLGIRVTGPEQAPVLSHRGSTPGAQALLVAIPSRRVGLVIAANAGHGDDLVFALAERLLGEPIPR